jgi:putative SOS response-associated peptidase YedK
MFSRMQLLATPGEISRRFGIGILAADQFEPAHTINAFDHLTHPVITRQQPNAADCSYRWGLVPPDWNKSPEAIQNHTISAKLEYIDKRYTWKQVAQNRCLIPATAYFEYHWNDQKGKSKTRYIIRHKELAIFALAGLYAEWKNGPHVLHTFAVCTTVGNKIMQFVHNKDAARNYFRMPVMLNKDDEHQWLDVANHYMDFAYPNYQPNLFAEPEVDTMQGVLF